MRVLPFYQVQFGLLDETSLLGHAGFRPKTALRDHVSRRKHRPRPLRHVSLSRLVRIGPGVGKNSFSEYSSRRHYGAGYASLNVIDFFLA